jgi:triosephosphate isomerase
MTKHHAPLVIGNWKMNPISVTEVKTIVTSLKTSLKKNTDVTVVIVPPALYLMEVQKLLGTSTIGLGAQTVNQAPMGAQTGEHSIPMLSAIGVSSVIVGHSERRALGETDDMVGAKVAALIKSKLTPVVCIGECERDAQGNFFMLIEAQIKAALVGVPKARFKDVVIAYEPIWAIGTGKTATAEDVNEMRLFIQKILTKHFDRPSASKIRIIYGGSVSAQNAADLFVGGGVDGFLVGGASLRPQEFTQIISSVK